MKYFFICGETSGDLHASVLMRKLSEGDSEAVFVGLGGDSMQAAGCRLVRHIKDMAFMGVVAVVKNIRKVRMNFRIAKEALINEKPDVLVLVDYPSFNLRMATFCKKKLPQTKIVYYIPPKIWAWKTWRVHKIGKLCDEILCIFPFEVDFYANHGYSQAQYVGNPTMEEISSRLHSYVQTDLRSNSAPTSYIAILPGSRPHEIEKCLPRMIEAGLRQHGRDLVIAGLSSVEEQLYLSAISVCSNRQRVHLSIDDTFEVLSRAEVAIVNSGTATLEVALLGVPQVAVYHLAVGRFLYKLKPYLFKIPYFTLPNIIAGKEVIREWLAYRFTAENVAADVHDIIVNPERRTQMMKDYDNIRTILGDKKAAEEAAKIILHNIK